MEDIPQAFHERIALIHGDLGRDWLVRLPALLDELARAWELRIDPPVSDLSYNYVAPATDGARRSWMLKLTVPGSWEGDRETIAMRAYDGHGAARVARYDPKRRATLLERVEPGRDLREIPDPQATEIVADVLVKLWQAEPPGGLAGLDEWTTTLERFTADPGPLPRATLDKAVGLRRDLLVAPPERVVVHGDLHHANVLWSDARGWLAIDPKGLVGEKAFDIPFFLLNPGLVPPRTTRLRVDTFVERLGLDRERVVGWSFVQAVASACWTIEDGGTDWQGGFGFAEGLRGI